MTKKCLVSLLPKILFSTRTGGLLLFVFAVSMAIATFIENDYGTETAKAVVYSAKWFEIVMLLLAINFAGNIAKYNLWSWRKTPILLFHLAFIIIILGAGITKYRGYEGLMTIKEGESTGQIISMDSYVQLRAQKGAFIQNFVSHSLLLSEIGSNTYMETFTIEDKEIAVELSRYVPKAQYTVENSKFGKAHLHLVLTNNQERKDFYIEKGTREVIYGIPVAFEYEHPLHKDISIQNDHGTWKVRFPEDTNYFNMVENRASFYPADSLVPLQFKALSQIGNTSIVFNTVRENVIRTLTTNEQPTEKKNPESAVVLTVRSGSETKKITLFGGKGYVNPFSSLFINGIHLDFRYGSKPIPLPFSVRLRDFVLERYPGSDSPSAFYSHVAVADQENTFDYTLFMNNVMNYKGYRFFQSAYTPDEKGTVLSVNKDYWGTHTTYLGYGLLGLGMLLSIFWKGSHFEFLYQLLKTS